MQCTYFDGIVLQIHMFVFVFADYCSSFHNYIKAMHVAPDC